MPVTSPRPARQPEPTQHLIGHCSLGHVLVAGNARGLCAIALGDTPDSLLAELRQQLPQSSLASSDSGLAASLTQIIDFIEHPAQPPALTLDIHGTPFQRQVWQALAAIPPGSTRSYSEIAALLGAPHASRAVAGACAANRLAVIIPCHRVVRRDGALSGYRWGVARKAQLLARETALHPNILSL